MSAFSTRLTRGALAATASTARLTTSIASSHVGASIVVNIEVVSFGSPDSRTTRTASATTSPTLSVPPPEGATLNATSMATACRTRLRPRDRRPPPPITLPWHCPLRTEVPAVLDVRTPGRRNGGEGHC